MISISRCCLAILAASTQCQAFVPLASWGRTISSSSSSSLYISSFGISSAVDTLEKANPEEQVQAYLPEPSAVEARGTLDGTCLVSGVVRTQGRTDQFLFDLLNHEESAFEYDKIVAFVNDAKFAKKRLLSRSARYTGLLDKLDFVQAESEGALPTAEQLEGVKSWVAYLDGGDQLQQVKDVAALAKASSLSNVAILLGEAQQLTDADACSTALESLKEAGVTYTVVAVGKLEDRPEGQVAYHYADFGTEEGLLPADTVFSREESYRMVTELLQLASGSNRALSFAEVYNPNVTEAKLVRGLRQAGYARMQEIDHMVSEGPEAYKKAIEEWRESNPDYDKGYTTDAWWEADIYKQSRQRSADREKAKESALQDERTQEVEALAREWAKREFFRRSMAGTLAEVTGASEGMTEEEFIQAIWDRAVFEGDLKYRQMQGESTDDVTELADFKAQQERKQQTMMQRAKDELADMLDEENLGGEELKKKWEEEEDEPKED